MMKNEKPSGIERRNGDQDRSEASGSLSTAQVAAVQEAAAREERYDKLPVYLVPAAVLTGVISIVGAEVVAHLWNSLSRNLKEVSPFFYATSVLGLVIGFFAAASAGKLTRGVKVLAYSATALGVWIGLRPKLAERVQPLAQFLAAFPANLAFPVFVLLIVRHNLNANVWLSPLMILGTQWYILFNVIAGASAFPSDLREAAASLHLTGWRWWIKVILPGIFPYYVTGAITASGGSWNASIVAEVASWGDTHLSATGLGAYIAKATEDSYPLDAGGDDEAEEPSKH